MNGFLGLGGKGSRGSQLKRYRASFWGDKNVLKLILVMVYKSEYTENH